MTITLVLADVTERAALREMFDAYLAEASINTADYPDFDTYWDGGDTHWPPWFTTFLGQRGRQRR
jgi:hypothetical protein